MVDKAICLACDEVGNAATCSDLEYEELKKLPEEEALMILAHGFLQEAADYNFGK